MATEAELALDALRRAPDSVAAFRRYAALLLTRGDPRAEVIALSCDLAESPKDKGLARKVTAARKKRSAELLGAAYLSLVDEPGCYWDPALEWFCGFVRAASFSCFDEKIWDALAAAPALRGPVHVAIDGGVDDPTRALERSPLPWILSLRLGSSESESDTGALANVLPRDALTVFATRLDFEPLCSETLRRIHLAESQMPLEILARLGASRLPRVEELVLDLGWLEVTDASLAAIASFAACDALPSLRRLALRGSADLTSSTRPRTIEILRTLLGSPLGQRLSSLDLSIPTREGDRGVASDGNEVELLFGLDEMAPELRESSMKVHFVRTFSRRAAPTLRAKYGTLVETHRSFVDE